jgi:UDP-glucose 4-epimerase
MKKILITGVNGFLGKALADKLSKNFKIYGIGYNRLNVKNKNLTKIINKKVNLYNISNNFKKIDYIIHCAGIGSVRGFNNLKQLKSDAETTKNVLEYIAKYSPETKLIYISSVSVYGDSYKNKIRENCKVNPISIYAKSKILSEDFCKHYQKKFNISVVILRVSSLYGNGLKKQVIYDSVSKILKNNNFFYGTGNEIRNFLHINDFLSLIYKIIKKNFKNLELYNCGGDQNIKIVSVINKLKKIIKKKIKPEFNKSYTKLNPKSLRVDNKKIKKEFKWKPIVRIDVGLKNYYQWYSKQND